MGFMDFIDYFNNAISESSRKNSNNNNNNKNYNNNQYNDKSNRNRNKDNNNNSNNKLNKDKDNNNNNSNKKRNNNQHNDKSNKDNDNKSNNNEQPNIYLKFDTEDKKNTLKYSVRNIKNEIPGFFNENNTDEENLKYLIGEVFREDYNNDLYFTNASYTIINEKQNEERRVRRLYLRVKEKGRFLQDNMPNNLTLSFGGFIREGFFVIDEIKVIGEHAGKKDYEREIRVFPYHTNIPKGHRGKFLNELINSTESKIEDLNKNFENWRAYLSWREELVKIRLVGIKYFNRYYYYDNENNLPNIVFQLVSPSKKDFDKIRKYLRRENIKVFNNSYSTDEWQFKFNEKNKNRNAMDLGSFSSIIKEISYNPTDEEIKKIKDGGKSNNGRDFNINGEYKKKIESISQNPYLVEIAFEIGEDYYDEVRDRDLNKNEMEEFINNNIINKIKGDGFLALSAVGEFALLRRLKEAISKLGRDEGYATNLASWLFDIKKAEIPSIENVNINKWLNKGIENNEHQKLAVEKMIATKDVCLIQGPPGTGKTTVIAEAIYQFASRGERVLIASQTNLAVDNALERLAKEPVIRAIRLNVSKTTEDIAHMTEDKVLKYFFSNISNKLRESYLNIWENHEKLLNIIETSLRDIKEYDKQNNDYNNRLEELSKEKDKLNEDIQQFNKVINEIKDKNSNIKFVKTQIGIFNKFIKDLTERNNSESEFVIPKDFISKILSDIIPHLNSLNDINLDRLNIRNNINNMEDDIATKGLKEIFKNVYRFYDLESMVSKSDNKSNPELELLKSKRDEVQEEIKTPNISDEKYDELFDELKELNKKINNFKTDTFELKETHKALLSDNTVKEFIVSKDINIIKNVTGKSVIAIDNINNILKNIKNYSDDYESKLNEEDFKQKENQLKISEGRKSVILNEEKEIREHLENINKNINNIKKENGIDHKNIYKILEDLEERKTKLQDIIENSKDIKNKFGDFIKEFNDKLENIDIKCENEYYKDTYINSCNVVGISCTENSKVLEDKGFKHFDVTIIDEVSKATPPELLIPMLKAKKVILVGDHRQLPPLFGEYERSYKEIIDNIEDTEENKEVKKILTEENFKKFENMVTSSIFKEYFEEANENIKHSLLIQFRMHSDIMDVINRFYENKLKSGITKQKEDEAKAHLLEIKRINNLNFITKNRHAYWIDSSYIKMNNSKTENIYESTTSTSTSIYNVLEAYIAVELLKKIASEYKKLNLDRKVSIGIISLYQLQVNRIRDMIKKERKKNDFSAVNIDVNTVDRFQGKEKEIIIVSLVRNPESGKSRSKHITAFERVNVAFSRAQNALFIIGAQALYKKLEVEMPYMDKKGTQKLKVYKDIIDYLYKNASCFESDCVIDYNKADNIFNEYNRKNK